MPTFYVYKQQPGYSEPWIEYYSEMSLF